MSADEPGGVGRPNMRGLLVKARNGLCIGLLVALTATACSTGDDSGAPNTSAVITVTYTSVREQGSAGYAAADLQGYFADQGLKFSPTWATSGSVILQGLLSGDFDVANVGPAQLFEAIKNGACARVLRPTEGAAYGIISQPELHLALDGTPPYSTALKQLVGKTIGIPARGAAQELVLRRLLTDAGVDPDRDVSWIAIAAGAAAVTAFDSGQVDAAMSYVQLEENLRANGTAFDKLADLSGPESPLGEFWQAVAVANCEWADSHPDTVLKFCHALNQGFAALADDPTVGPKAFAYANVGATIDQSTKLWTTNRNPTVHIPAFTEKNWDYQARFTRDNYAPDFSKYVVSGCATA